MTRRHAIAAASGLGIAALVPRGAVWSADGDTLHARLARDIKTFDPAFQSGNEHPIIRAVSTQLTTFGPDGSADTMLYGAESIEQIDATHIAFTLHEGIVWTNGYGPLTAEDVQYTFERAASEELESPWRDYWAVLDHVEVIDDRSGVIVLKEPFAPLWTISLPGELGNIVCKPATEEMGGTYTTDVPATAGAYMVKEWAPQERLVLEADPNWPLAKPQFTVVEYTVIEDAKVAELAFDAGELNYTPVSNSSLPMLRGTPPEGATLLERPSLTYLWLGMNVEHPTLADERVRKAIQYTVDIDQVIDGAYAGLALRANGIVPPSLPGHRDYRLVEKPDLDQARAYLDEAGVPDGFHVTLSIENVAERRAAAEIVQAQLAQIGINAEILSYDSGAFWSLGIEADGDDWKDLQLFLQKYSSSVDPFDCTAWHTPSEVGKWNWQRWSNAEFGELHTAAMVETNPETRKQMYIRMQDLMEESAAFVVIAHELNGALVADGITPAVDPQFRDLPHMFEKS